MTPDGRKRPVASRPPARRGKAVTATRMSDPATRETMVDETLQESFPASDPPTWVPFSRLGTPQRGKRRQRQRWPT